MHGLKTFWALFRHLSPLLALIFLSLWLRSCYEHVRESKRYEDNLRTRETTIRSYKLANGQLAHEKDLLIVTNEELKNQVWIKDDSLKHLLETIKDPVTAVKWRTRYVYDTVHVPFDTPVEQEFQRSFSKTEEWFSLSGTVDRNGISIDNISIPNTQRLVVGYSKGKPVVSVSNSNPYIVTEEIEGQTTKLPEKQWVLGLGGTWNFYEPPSAGFFFGYKLLEF